MSMMSFGWLGYLVIALDRARFIAIDFVLRHHFTYRALVPRSYVQQARPTVKCLTLFVVLR